MSRARRHRSALRVLAVDIGGTHVKVLLRGEDTSRKAASGPKMTARDMVRMVHRLARGWRYDVASIGFPGVVWQNRPFSEPRNLGPGWVNFDYQSAFGCPVRILNDAAMQAIGSYEGGRMLFLGLGTGLGSAFIVDRVIEPMELGHLPYKKATFEDYVGARGLKRYGKKKWRRFVKDVVKRLIAALEPDDVVIGGGNVHKLKELPAGCRAGDNVNAFRGGFRLWDEAFGSARESRQVRRKAAAFG